MGPGYRIGSKILDPVSRILDPKSWIQVVHVCEHVCVHIPMVFVSTVREYSIIRSVMNIVRVSPNPGWSDLVAQVSIFIYSSNGLVGRKCNRE